VISGVKGSLAAGIDQIYETLAVTSLDEVSAAYCLLAEAVSFPSDFSWTSYRLRPEAKWHDGKPVTPDDVIFSFQAFKKYSPLQSAYYRQVVTRGKRLVVLVGQKKAIAIAVRNVSGRRRWAKLAEWLHPLCN
jgi:microcin C transport system substrate-binding protein